jgi:hypothetical protein
VLLGLVMSVAFKPSTDSHNQPIAVDELLQEGVVSICQTQPLVGGGLESLGDDRTDPIFARSVSFSVKQSNVGASESISCDSLDHQLTGTLTASCETNGTWVVKGGCRQRTCPEYSHWSNGALILFKETASGELLSQDCPLTFASKHFTGKVTFSCPEDQPSWVFEHGQCLLCDRTCENGELAPSTCLCECHSGFSGDLCEVELKEVTVEPPRVESNVNQLVGNQLQTSSTGAWAKPEDMGFPLFYLVMFLWRNLGEMLNPTIFMIMLMLLKVPQRLRWT